MSDRMKLPEPIAAVVEESVRGVHRRVPGVTGCIAATVDGRLLEHVVDNTADPRRMAAMIGSMVALGETIGKEVRIGRSQFVVVHALDGILLMQRVPSRKELLVVATLARTTTNLGVVLHETRRAAGEIGEALDRWLQSSAA
ncbi:MAG: roadblock/LC7 domain-containing protein [Xanthomonadales bacterium]|nr:roadblock/LC7 domain-containing protein [Xanthomonadales bacterium]